MDWEFSDEDGAKILLVSKGGGPGLIDEDLFDIQYHIIYNADITVDISAWEVIEVDDRGHPVIGEVGGQHYKYVEVTEEELALLLLIYVN